MTSNGPNNQTSSPVRLVQLREPGGKRRIALVDGDRLLLLAGYDSIYELATAALHRGERLANAAIEAASDQVLDYDSIYSARSEWSLLPAFDHPHEPARCIVSGTGLTHMASAENRAAMHAKAAELTDSMKMYLSGVESGRPAPGSIGVAPEWFYKGTGTILRAHGEPLDVPAYACDGGEEPEIAGAYIIDGDGRPWRAGLMMGNEFSDHVFEKRSYLYLAPSKLRNCAIGPELVVDADFTSVPGQVTIKRNGAILWSQAITSGEAKMCHSLANIEHHHFKFEQHRRPGDAHVHFFGADAFSFGAGIALQNGDEMTIAFENFGRPLRNPVRVAGEPDSLIAVSPL
jgi:hypothetical protein